MSRKNKRAFLGVGKGIIFIIVCLFFIAPYLWMVLISLHLSEFAKKYLEELERLLR